MNPFTRFLLNRDRKEGQALEMFVERWDALETLVIRIFRGKAADTADEDEYHQLHTWLLINYPQWQDRLQPYWQETLVGGSPAAQDPFQRLLEADKAAAFSGDWEAMQHLPAAREALNRFIQSHKE
jgi:hypothetical protein